MSSKLSIQKKNNSIYIIKTLCASIASSFENGAFITSFMLFLGLSARQISTIDSINNGAMLLASLLVLFAYKKDPAGVTLLRIFSFGCVVLPIGYLLSSILPARTAFAILILFGLIASLMNSARNSVEVNVAPLLFGREHYTRLLGISGIVGGIFTLFVSSGLISHISVKSERTSYQTMFSIAGVLMFISAVLSLFYTSPKVIDVSPSFELHLSKILTRKYLAKSLPHILRGIGATGVVLFSITVLTRVTLSPAQKAALIPLSTLAGITASLVLASVSIRIRPGTMVMLSFLLMALVIAAGPFIRTAGTYFILYTILMFANSIGSRCTMASVVYACEREDLAIMSSLHILYYSIAYSPSMVLFGRYVEFHAVPVMTLCALFLSISGVLFHKCFRRMTKG